MAVDTTGGLNNGNVYLSWASFFGGPPPTIFFSRSIDGGATFSTPFSISALGTSNMKVVFTNSAPGAPLPDLAFVSFKSLSLWASASGPLRSLFGVPEGTQGQMIVIQQGYFATSFQGAMVDGFPAEQINLIVK